MRYGAHDLSKPASVLRHVRWCLPCFKYPKFADSLYRNFDMNLSMLRSRTIAWLLIDKPMIRKSGKETWGAGAACTAIAGQRNVQDVAGATMHTQRQIITRHSKVEHSLLQHAAMKANIIDAREKKKTVATMASGLLRKPGCHENQARGKHASAERFMI